MIPTLVVCLIIGIVVVIIMGAMARSRANKDLTVGTLTGPVVAAPAPRPMTAQGADTDLDQLRNLHEKGALTSEEYAAARARLAGGQSAGSGGLYQAVLTRCGDQKIAVIKEVRELTGLGLKEAKDAVEGPPFVLGQGLTADQAAKIQSDFAAVGAQVDLR